MNIVRATHQLAMDMNALAELSKAKGFYKDATEFYIKAYELEKKAALMTDKRDSDALPHFLLLRSAAALAFKSGLYKESELLIEICLSENPPKFIIEDLKEITSLLQKQATSSQEERVIDLQIKGLLTSVDAAENKITIRDETQELQYAVIVPTHQLASIIQQYWYQLVLIQVRQTNFGVMILEHIKKAA